MPHMTVDLKRGAWREDDGCDEVRQERSEGQILEKRDFRFEPDPQLYQGIGVHVGLGVFILEGLEPHLLPEFQAAKEQPQRKEAPNHADCRGDDGRPSQHARTFPHPSSKAGRRQAGPRIPSDGHLRQRRAAW